MNYCKFFRDYSGRTIKVTMTNGEIFVGKLVGYVSADDNEPDPESILIDYTELFTNEIDDVCILK